MSLLNLGSRKPSSVLPAEVEAARRELAAIEAAAKVESDRQAAMAKDRAAKLAKVEKEFPALTDKLAAEFNTAWAAAVLQTAERVAKYRLAVKHGLGPGGYPGGDLDEVLPDHVLRRAREIITGVQLGLHDRII